MNHDRSEQSSNDDWVIQLYEKHSTESPDRELDKIIIAAAHRESIAPEKKREKNSLSLSFWHRLRIPASILGAMAVTITIAHVMWPMVQTTQHVANGDVISDATVSPIELDKVTQSRESFAIEMDNLKQRQSTRDAVVAENHDRVKADSFYEIPSQISRESIQEGAVLSATLQDGITWRKSKELWANQIENFAKNGEFEKMNKELEKFHQSFPDYPIMEQIRPYLR